MTIPNVYMKWCERTSTCKWCGKPIELATPMVHVYFWNKGGEDRKWNRRYCYHPECWVGQGLDYLKMNPFVSKRPERWKMPLTNGDREQRVILLRRKAAIDQRRRNMKDDYPDRLLIEARLDAKVADIMVEIHKVGGIPKKWLE